MKRIVYNTFLNKIEKFKKFLHPSLSVSFHKLVHINDLIFLFTSKSFFSNLFYMVYQESLKNRKKNKNEISTKKLEDQVMNKTISFYSLRMLIIHLKSFTKVSKSKTVRKQKMNLLKYFDEYHPFDCLKDYFDFKKNHKGRLYSKSVLTS